MRTCSACGLSQEHSYPYCKKCAAALSPVSVSASQATGSDRVCPACRAEQHHSYPFCDKCGAALCATVEQPLQPSRCLKCGAVKDASWRVCERCGAGAPLPTLGRHWFGWAAIVAFTALWAGGLIVWWYFTYRVAIGPFIAGSVVLIDGKPIATLPSAADEWSTPLLSRGKHTVTVRAPDHIWVTLDFRAGWTGLRRRFTIAQLPEIACVTVAGPPYPAVTLGTHGAGGKANEFCAPAGRQAVAEWRGAEGQEHIRKPFKYIDGTAVAAVSPPSGMQPPEQPPNTAVGGPEQEPSPTTAPNQSPAAPGPLVNPATARQRAAQLVRECRALFGRREYKSAIAACNQAVALDPTNAEAARLRTQIQQTMQVLGISPQADAATPGQRIGDNGLSVAKMIAAVNPDLEVISTDESAGTITLREKTTNKVVTMTLKDVMGHMGQGRRTLSTEAAEGFGNRGGVYRVGNGVSAPSVLYKREPDYSEAARSAKVQGTVVLYLEVDETGHPRNLRVVRGLGLGLDEKAVEAVSGWRFRPGYKDGKPVTVAATIQVEFRLL